MKSKANVNKKLLLILHGKPLKFCYILHHLSPFKFKCLDFSGPEKNIFEILRCTELSESIQSTESLETSFKYSLSILYCEIQQSVSFVENTLYQSQKAVDSRACQNAVDVCATDTEQEVFDESQIVTFLEWSQFCRPLKLNYFSRKLPVKSICFSSCDTCGFKSHFSYHMFKTSLFRQLHDALSELGKTCQLSGLNMDLKENVLNMKAFNADCLNIDINCFQDSIARCLFEVFNVLEQERTFSSTLLVLCISMDFAQSKRSDTYLHMFQSMLSNMRQHFDFQTCKKNIFKNSTSVKTLSRTPQAENVIKSCEIGGSNSRNNFSDTVLLQISVGFDKPQENVCSILVCRKKTEFETTNADCSRRSVECLVSHDVEDAKVFEKKSNEFPDILCSQQNVLCIHYASNPCESDFPTSVKQQFSWIGELYLHLVLLILQIAKLLFSLKLEPWTLDLVHRRASSTFATTAGSERLVRSFIHQENVDLPKTSSPPPQQISNHTNPAHPPIVLSDSPGSTEAGHENVRRESFRLSSFQHFPPSVPINARQFAAAGFFYTGMFDEVKCFACSNVLRNLTASNDPFLLRMHKTTCRFARGQDECGNVRLGQFGSGPAIAQRSASSTSRPSAGEVLFGAPPSYQNASARSAPAPHLNSSGVPRVRLASQTTTGGPVRHYEGLDMRNYQSARPVAPPPSTYDVPLHRQLATIQNPDQARLIRSLNLCRETHRYQTFNSDWPLDSAPSGREMAASGWFYLGNLDRTQCFSCGGVLRNWRRLDNPTTEHISHFPHCAMAQGRESRNIPDTSRQAPPPNRSGLNELTAQQRSDLRNMFPCEFPVTPSMRSVQDRVNSFNNWSFTRATPQMIAEAGFYSLGVRDRVKCHYCNGGLQNWRQDDNPWEEHAKWYPTCEFLLQQRGPEYIHTIVARFPNINRPILHAPGQDVPPAPQIRSGPPTLHPPAPERQSSGETSRTQEQQQNQDPIDVAMRSEFATTVIGMGFEEPLVRDVMRVNIEQHGVGYQSATTLLDAVMAEQSARDAQESTPEPSMEINLPDVSFLDEENMSDVELYESGLEASGIDVSESGLRSPPPSSLFSPSISMSRSSISNPFSSTSGQNATSSAMTTSTPHSSSSFLPNVMGASIEPSFKETAPMAPQGITSLPQPRPQAATSKRETELQDRAKSLPEATEDKEELAKKLQQLKDERLCKVCLDRTADMVFIPCGHICCCMECTRALRTCPICRKKIEKAVRTYTS